MKIEREPVAFLFLVASILGGFGVLSWRVDPMGAVFKVVAALLLVLGAALMLTMQREGER